jgi:putative DNA primase/helicase
MSNIINFPSRGLTTASELEESAFDEPKASEGPAWLWENWMVTGRFHVLAGLIGAGKTGVALYIAATVSSGGTWPDGSQSPQGDVLIINELDELEEVLLPRLMVYGADCSRIHFMDPPEDEEGEPRYFDPYLDCDTLKRTLRKLERPIRLIIIDPIISMADSEDFTDTEFRAALRPIARLARDMNVAILGTTYLSEEAINDKGKVDAESLTCSPVFNSIARVMMITSEQRTRTGRRGENILVRARSEIGPSGGGYDYVVKQAPLPDYPHITTQKLVWGKALDGPAQKLLDASPRRRAATQKKTKTTSPAPATE